MNFSTHFVKDIKNSALLRADHGAVCKLMVCRKISGNFSPNSGPENTSKFHVAFFLKVTDELVEGDKTVSRKLYQSMGRCAPKFFEV